MILNKGNLANAQEHQRYATPTLSCEGITAKDHTSQLHSTASQYRDAIQSLPGKTHIAPAYCQSTQVLEKPAPPSTPTRPTARRKVCRSDTATGFRHVQHNSGAATLSADLSTQLQHHHHHLRTQRCQHTDYRPHCCRCALQESLPTGHTVAGTAVSNKHMLLP
jgi:hypothetical protein